jgi:hypothetical protein
MAGRKKVSIIETTLVPLPAVRETFGRILPEVELISFVDESLLEETKAAGQVTRNVIRRYCAYAVFAESIGSHLIFNQCSSVGEVVEIAQQLVGIPILKTDLPMAEEAVQRGERIAVLATASTTVGPTRRLIESVARQAGKTVQVSTKLCTDAFLLLSKSDREGHNRMLIEAVHELEKEADVIVLAQGSMAVLLDRLQDVRVPVLASLESGVLRAKAVLEGME